MPNTLQLEIEVIACPICGTRDHEHTYLDEHLATRFVRCQQCRSVYLNPRPGAGPRASYYEGTDRQIRSQLRVARSRAPAFQVISRALHRYKQNGTYLDVGCSTGAIFDHFDHGVWRRYGIEPDAELASYAAMVHGAQIHTGILDDVEFPAASFDLVTMIDTIYLIPDPQAALCRIHGLLKPGGVLGVEFAGQAYMLGRSVGLMNYLFDGRWSRLRTDGRHLYFFTPDGMRELLAKAGFKALEWIPIQRMGRLMASCSGRLLNYCPKLLCIAVRV
jgi:SAM-dependent methyltransferase